MLTIIKTKLKKFLIDLVLSVSGWFLELNFIKVTALITVVCFFISSVAGQAVSAVLEENRGSKKLEQVFNSLSIPYTAGRITESKYFGSKQVIINVQDLHCHAEVQRNISRILSILDEKYKLNNIYLEGAYDNVDTSWLVSIQDKEIRQKIVNFLIDQGKLTGAEYYSIVAEKPNIIKGIENKNLYAENFLRLQKILDNQRAVNAVLSNLDYYITQLREEYFNSKQKKLGSVISQYRSGTISAKKFYTILKKYSDKLHLDIGCYRNLSAYVELIDKEKKLNYRRIASQLQKFTLAIKQNLPYAVYKELVDKTENFKKLDNLYSYLINLSKECKIDLSISLPDLYNFFDYVKLNEKINPLALLEEEEYLLAALRSRLCDSDSQREVTFAVNFFRFFELYFNNKISARDYEYFIENIDKFKFVWKKYINNDRLLLLDPYLSLFSDFYKANLLRNECFVSNILGNNFDTGIKNENNTPVINDEEKILQSLENGSEIKVVVTGGFHTEGLIKLFKKRKISYIVITPNVTTDTKISTEIYEKLAREQRKILFQAYALLAISLGTTEDKAKEILMPLINNYLNKKTFNINSALEAIKKAFNEATKSKFTLEVISQDADGFPNKIVAKEKVKGTIIASSDYDEANKKFVTSKTEEEKKADNFKLEDREASASKSTLVSVISGIWILIQTIIVAVCPVLLVSTVITLIFAYAGEFAVFAIGIIGIRKYTSDVSWMKQIIYWASQKYPKPEDFENIDKTEAPQSYIDNIAKDPIISELLKAKIRKDGKTLGENIKLVYWPELNGTTVLFQAHPEDNSIHVNYPLLKEATKDLKFNKYLNKVRMAARHDVGHIKIWRFFEKHKLLGKIRSKVPEEIREKIDENWCALGDLFDYWFITRKSRAIPSNKINFSKKAKTELPVIKENPPIIAVSLWNRLGMFLLTLIPAIISLGLTIAATAPIAVTVGIIISISLFVALPLIYLLEFLAILAGGRDFKREDYSIKKRTDDQIELKDFVWNLCTYEQWNILDVLIENGIEIIVDSSPRRYSLGRFEDGAIRLNYPAVKRLVGSKYFGWLWKRVIKNIILHEMMHGLFTLRFPGIRKSEKSLTSKIEKLELSKEIINRFYKRFLKVVRWFLQQAREILISLNDVFYFLTLGHFYIKFDPQIFTKQTRIVYAESVFNSLFKKLSVIPVERELNDSFNSLESAVNHDQVISKFIEQAQLAGVSYPEGVITLVKLVENNSKNKSSIRDMLNYIEKYKNTISEIAAAEKDSSNAVVLILAENKLLEFMASLLLDLLIDKKGNLKYIIYKFNIDSKWEGNEVYDGLEMLKSTLKLFLDSNSSLADILDLDELKNLEKRIDLISKKEILFNRFVIDAGASKEYILELLASSEEAAKAVPDFAELLEKYGNIETALDEAINSSSIVEGIKSAFNYYKQTSDPAILRLIANKISEIVIEQKIQDKKNESAYEMFETVFGKPGNKEILMIEQENDYKRNKIIYDILRAIFGKPQTKSETMLKLNDVNELAYEIREIIGEPETGEGAELKAKKLKNRMEAYGIVFKTALEFAYSFYESKPVQRSQKETILETAKKFMENIPKNQFISGEVQGIAQHEEEVALRDIKASAENRIYEETYYARGKNGEAIAKAIENIMKTVSFFERKGTPGESEENGYFEAIGYVDVLYCKSKDENYIRGLEIFFETNNNPKMFEHFIEQDILMTLVQAAPETTANLLDSICTIILKNNRSREYIVVGIAKLIQSLNTGFLAPITYEKDGVKVEMERKIFHILRDFFKKYRLSRKDFLNEFIPKEGRRTEFQTLIKLICDAIPEEKPLIAKLMFAIYFEDSDRTPESVMSAFKHAAELIGISLDNRTDTSPDLQDIIDQFALITLDYLNQEYISAPALENSKEELKQAILSSNEPYKNEIIKYLSMPSFLENIAFFGNIEDLEKAIIEGLKCTTSSDAPSRKEIDEYLSAFSLKKLEDLKQEILSSDKPFKDEIIKYLTKPDFIGKSVEDLRRLILSSDGPYRKEINEYLSAYELKNIADLNGEIREHREKNMEDLKQELLSSDEPFKKEIMKHLGPAHKSVRKFRLVILLESDLLYRKEINEYLSAFALKNNGPVEETIMDYLDINITDLKRAILSSEEPSKNEIIKSLASLALENPTIDELVNMLELSQMIIRHGDISTLTKEEKAEKPLFNTRLKFWVDLNVPPAGINYGTLESAKAAYEKARELGGIALDKVSVFGILEQLFKENLKSKGEKAFKKFIKIFIKELTMNKRPILGFTLNDKQLLAKLVFTVYFGVSDGTPKSARAAYKKAKKLTGIVLDKSLIFDILKTFLLKYFENNGEYAFTKFIRKLKLFDKQLLAKLVFAVYLEVPYMYGNPLSALETYEKASEKTKELTGTALDKSLVFDVLKDFLKKYLGEKKEYAFKKFIKGFTLYDNQMLAELLFQVYYDGSTLESALDACEMMRELTGVTLDKSLVKARQLTGIPFNKLLIFYSLKSTFKAYFKNNGKDAFEEYVKRFKLFIKDSLQIAVLIFVVYFDIGKDKTPEFAVAACRDAAKLVGIALDEQFKNEVIKYLSALALDNTQALKEAIFSISPIGPANVSSAIAALSSFETKVSDATHAKPEVNLRLEAAFISALVLTSSLWTGIQIALTPVFAIYLWFVSASLLIVGSIATFYFIVNLLLAISSTSITKSQVPIQKVMFSKSLDPNLKKLVTTDLPSELSRKLTLDENEKDKILLMIDYDLPKNISMISDYENMSIIRINPLEIIKYYRMPLKIADRIQRKIYIWSFDVKLAHEIRRIEKKLKGYRGEIKNFNYDTGYVLKQIYRAISRKNKRLAVVESESIESLSGNIKNHAVKPVTNGRKPSMSLKNRIGMLFYSIIKIVIPAGIALTVVGFAGAIIITVGLIWFAIIAGSVFSIVVIISFISIKDLKILKNQLVYIFKAQKERKERAEMLDEKTRDLELRILSRENAIINADNILKKGIFRPSESIATWEEKKKNYENERESRIKEASAYIAELGSEEHKLFEENKKASEEDKQKIEKSLKNIEKKKAILEKAVAFRTKYETMLKYLPLELKEKLEYYGITLSIFPLIEGLSVPDFSKGEFGNYLERQNQIRMDLFALDNPEFAELIISHEVSHREFIDEHPLIHKYMRRFEELMVSRRDKKLNSMKAEIVRLLNEADPIISLEIARTFVEALNVADSAISSSNPSQATQQVVSNLYDIVIPQYGNPNIGIAIQELRIVLVNVCARPNQEINRINLMKALVQLRDVINNKDDKKDIDPKILESVKIKGKNLFDIVCRLKHTPVTVFMMNESETNLANLHKKADELMEGFYEKLSIKDEQSKDPETGKNTFASSFKCGFYQRIDMPRTLKEALNNYKLAEGKNFVPIVIKFVKPINDQDDGIRIIINKKERFESKKIVEAFGGKNILYFGIVLIGITFSIIAFYSLLVAYPLVVGVIIVASLIIGLGLQFRKRIKQKGEKVKDKPEEEIPYIPVISVNLKNAINPVNAVANGIICSAIRSEYPDLQGRLFVMVSEPLGALRSNRENPQGISDIAKKLMLKKKAGMMPIAISLGATAEPIFSEPIDVPGYEKLEINVGIEKCEDDDDSSNDFLFLKLSCNDPDVPNEIVLGRGALAVLNRIKGDPVLLRKFSRYFGKEINEKIIKSAIVEVDGPSAAFVIPDTIRDQYTSNPLFDEMLFIYNIGKAKSDSGLFAGKINEKKYLLDILSLDRGIDLNKLGIIASDISFGNKTIYNNQFENIIKVKPDFNNKFEEELKWYETDIYIPGLDSKKKIYISSDNKIRVVDPHSLRQSGSIDFGSGKNLDLPVYVKNGTVIIRGFNDEVSINGYSGDPSLINWADIIERLGIKGIDLNSLLISDEERRNNKINKSKIIMRETYVAMKIHAELVNYKEFQKILKEYDPMYETELERFFYNLINYKSFEEFMEDFNNKKNKEYEIAKQIVSGKVEFETKTEQFISEKVLSELSACGMNLGLYTDRFNENKGRDIELAKKIFERVINKNKLKNYLDQFLKFMREIGYPGEYGQATWLDEYVYLKTYPSEPKGFLYSQKNYSLSCMLQWLFALQMKESIKNIHSLGGKLLFEMRISNEYSIKAMKYILSMGFDGVKLIIEKDKSTTIDEFKKMLNSDNLGRLSYTIKMVNPSAIVYISTSPEYLDELKRNIRQYPDFILSRKISEIKETEILEESMLLEINASFADLDLWEKIIKRLKYSNLKECDIAIAAGTAAGDPEFEINDPNYRLPPDINNRPMIAENLFDKITPLIGLRPKSPELLAKMGYKTGLNYEKIPSTPDKEWGEFFDQKRVSEREIELFNKNQVVKSGILGLMAAYFDFCSNNGVSKIFEKNVDDQRYIFNLVYETLKSSEILNKKNWPSGWLKIETFEKMALRKTASTEEKIGYVIEMFGFLRGIIEKIIENHYMEEIEKMNLANESDRRTLINFLTLRSIFKIEENMEYEIPDLVSNAEQNKELLKILSAKTPRDLGNKYSELLQTKYQTIHQMYSFSIILFVKALLNIRELKKKYPKEIKLTKDIDNLLMDNRLMEILNPIFGVIAQTGTIPELTSTEDEMPNVLGWAVNELIVMFDKFAERKITLPKDFKPDISINAVKNLLGAA